MKEFKTIDEQLELLKERGLIVPDDFTDQAKSFLLKNNYYIIIFNIQDMVILLFLKVQKLVLL